MITPLGKTSSLTVIVLCLKSLVTMDIGSDMVSSENSREDADEAFKI